MNWIQLISAVGVGALITKLMDVLWLQKVVHQNEHKKWLREQRLEAYSELTEELLSLGKKQGTREDPFKGYALVAKTTLLVEDERLAIELEEFFTNVSNLFTEAIKRDDDPTKKPESELNAAYDIVLAKSRRLVNMLRASIHEK